MRYRLRTVLLVVTLIACGIAWLDHRANRHRRQRQAVAQISRLGGCVAFVGGSKFEPPTSNTAFADLAAWFNDAIHPRTAWKIMFANYGARTTSIGDDDIPSLIPVIKDLPDIAEVRFIGAGVSHDGVARLRRELRNVQISTMMMKPETELTDIQKLRREERLIREHYERLGWEDPQVREEVEKFRRIWFELRDLQSSSTSSAAGTSG